MKSEKYMYDRASEKHGWYPVRVSPGGMDRFRSGLEATGMECYYNPAAFRDLCFVHGTRAAIDAVVSGMDKSIAVHYLWDGVKFAPAVVPDKLMGDFMKVAESDEESRLCLERVSTLLKDCRKVRVTSGMYSGIEGNLVRIKKTLRVMVALPGDIAVATGYIRPECMEVLV